MKRVFCILLVSLVLAPLWGCASNQHLTRKLDLLEKEVADLHQANRKINQRIDELQIQLSLINKKLAGQDSEPEKLANHPDLRVIKLRPTKTTKKAKTRINFSNKRRSMKEIDPRKVSEKLPVDTRAARRGLWGLDASQ